MLSRIPKLESQGSEGFVCVCVCWCSGKKDEDEPVGNRSQVFSNPFGHGCQNQSIRPPDYLTHSHFTIDLSAGSSGPVNAVSVHQSGR